MMWINPLDQSKQNFLKISLADVYTISSLALTYRPAAGADDIISASFSIKYTNAFDANIMVNHGGGLDDSATKELKVWSIIFLDTTLHKLKKISRKL